MIAAARTASATFFGLPADNAQVSIDLSRLRGTVCAALVQTADRRDGAMPDATRAVCLAKFARPTARADAALVQTTRRAHRAASR